MSEPTEPLEAPDETRPLGAGGGPERARPRPLGDGGGEDRRRFVDRDLPVAIASGVLLGALFIGSILWHPAAFAVLVGAVVLLGAVEASRAFRTHGQPVAMPVLVVAGVVTLVGAYRAGTDGQALGLVTLFVGAIVWELADGERRQVTRRLTATALLGIWLPFLGSFAIIVQNRWGWVATLATIGSAVFADIGAYVVGTRFGRHRLAPSVSPGKTWEGVLGGLLVAGVLAAAVLPLFGDLFSWPVAFAFAVAVGAVSVVGDLGESMVKRDLGTKDLGGIIPGHGGVLDRVDAIVLALPAGYFALELLGR